MIEKEKMKVISRSELRVIFDGDPLIVEGELLVGGKGHPDFVVYRAAPIRQEDGEPVDDSLKDAILQEVLRQAKAQGGRIEID